MHIKSKMLLPPDPSEVEEVEEDPRDELARRLLEYKKFKEIADTLGDKEIARRDFFSRMFDEAQREQIREDAKEIMLDVNLFDLITAFSDALKKVPEEVIHEIIEEKYTVEDKVHDLLHLLLEQSSMILQDLFSRCRHKTEMIATFLAILELIRLKEVKVVQKEKFGPIEILRNRENILPKDETDEILAPLEESEPPKPEGEQ